VMPSPTSSSTSLSSRSTCAHTRRWSRHLSHCYTTFTPNITNLNTAQSFHSLQCWADLKPTDQTHFLCPLFTGMQDLPNSSQSLHFVLTLPLLTFSAQRGPYCGMPRAISSHAKTVGARHRSMGMEAASRSSRSFSAYPSSVRGDQLR
jgi:hypothetical protein